MKQRYVYTLYALLVTIFIIVIIGHIVVNQTNYDTAIEAMEKCDYDKAEFYLEECENNGYRVYDARAKLYFVRNEKVYREVRKLIANEKYVEAYIKALKIADFKNTRMLINEMYDQVVDELHRGSSYEIRQFLGLIGDEIGFDPNSKI